MLIAILSTPLFAAVPGELRTIALSGQQAAGVPDATYQYIFGNANVNDHGQVTFGARLAGNSITYSNDVGYWLGQSLTSQTLIMHTGDQAPGLPAGIHFTNAYFDTPSLNNHGEVTFTAGIEAIQQSQATWTTAGGSLRLLAANGYPLPNAPGSPVVNFDRGDHLLNDAGQSAIYTQTGTVGSIWVDTPGQPLRRVISVGDRLPDSSFMTAKSVTGISLADNGRVAFDASASLNPFITYDGVWSEISGSLQLVARQSGNPPPGFSKYFYSVGIGDVAPNGILAFGGTINSGPYRVWYVQRPDGSLRFVTSTGAPIPGYTATFTNTYAPLVNANGLTAFLATLSNDPVGLSDLTSAWFEDSLGLHQIAHRGDLAPGAGTATFDSFTAIQFNDNGDVLIEGRLVHGIAGVTDANDGGLWLRDRAGQLTLLAREGDMLDVAPGPTVDLRQITYLESVGYSGEHRHTLTNNGEVLIFATFSDNSSGLFLTPAVPEPSALILSALAVPAILRRRSRTQLSSRVP